MGVHIERWSRANEELRFYDNQLQTLTVTPMFKSILSGNARKTVDPKLQLFKDFEKDLPVKKTRKRAVKNV